MKLPCVVLKSGKDQSVRRRHPWIFSGAIARVEGDVEDGDPVTVHTAEGEPVATGHYQTGSIAVRILAFEPVVPGPDFWSARLRSAYALRRQLGLTENAHTDVYRLVSGEGDGLPGLVVDYYSGTAVLQAHSTGMWKARAAIAEALAPVYGDRLTAVYDKSADTLLRHPHPRPPNCYLFGSGGDGLVRENDCRFHVDWVSGQKTGFFIDQRDNRRLLMQYAGGRRVLNAFCYSGGFSVYAAQAEAAMVHSIDSSRAAIEMTQANMALNGFAGAGHAAFATDALTFLKDADERYDLIVLDPPAFAKRLNARHQAVQGYKRLNAAAFRRLAPGGMLFTFSCSQVVDRALFNSTIQAAAIEVGRPVRVLHQLSQPPDHPVDVFHPEGEYLKGLVLHAE